MHATTLKLVRSPASITILSEVYNLLAKVYTLPSAQEVIRGLTTSVHWPLADYRIIFLDQIHPHPPANAPACVQIRFASSPDARAETIIELHVSLDSEVERLEVFFPGKSGKGCFSHCIEKLKTATHTHQIDIQTVHFEAEGFSEVNSAFIREHNVTAFRYIEAAHWYLHRTENEWDISSFRQFARKKGFDPRR